MPGRGNLFSSGCYLLKITTGKKKWINKCDASSWGFICEQVF